MGYAIHTDNPIIDKRYLKALLIDASSRAFADLLGASGSPFAALDWLVLQPQVDQAQLHEIIAYVYQHEADPPRWPFIEVA